ncbi:MAG: hypothetical protein EZS28_044801, partial [Streblomastix strix]
QGDTDNLVGKMFKVFEASVVSVSDAQVEREQRLEGVYQGPQTEDVLSQKTKERFKRKSAKLVIDERRGEQIEAEYWERNSFDPAEELNKAVCWEHVPFDSAKDVERARCGDQGFIDLAVGCRDQGSTYPAINQDERAGCGDQGSINHATNLDGLADKRNNLIKENRMKLKAQVNRIPLEQRHDMEQLIKESLYFPEVDQLTNKETIARISERVALTYPIGSLIDHSQIDTCITYHSSTGKEDQDTQIKSLLEEHQHPANIPIGGRLTHFVDVWKLIGADALVTRGIKAFWINTQAPQILERNMTNPVKIKSKDSQLALGKLIEKELLEDIIEE